MKKLIALGLSIACLTFGALSLTACGDDSGKTETPHTHTYNTTAWEYTDTHHYHAPSCGHTVEPEDCDGYAAHNIQDGKCSVCDYTQPLTLDEFVTDYKSAANDFVSEKIRSLALEGLEIKAENWTLAANENDTKLVQVNLVYTYVVNATDRCVEIAVVKLKNPIAFGDIAKGDCTVNASDLTVDRTSVLEFNAKTNHNKQDIAAALYEKANINAQVKLYAEVEATDAEFRSFYLLDEAEGKMTVTRIDVLKGDGSDETLLHNINRPFTKLSTAKEYNINGKSIYKTEYELENLGPDTPDDPDDPVDPPQPQPDPVTNAEIIAALNEYCMDGILKRCFIGVSIDKSKISDDNWYITKNSDDKITCAELVFTYNGSLTGASFRIGKAVFDVPISPKELKNGNIGTPTNSSVYMYSYNSTIQQTRAALTNAICDKVFGENTNAVRYIKDLGHGIDNYLGEIERFTVIQIEDNQLKEISIRIKYSQNDNEYIRKLSDFANYSTYDEKAYTISGTKVSE